MDALIPSGAAVDGSAFTPAHVARSAVGASGTTDCVAAIHPTLGPASDRVPPRYPALDTRARPGPLPDAAAAPPRPGHQAPGAQTQPRPPPEADPGERVHEDIKKLTRIPNGGRWRIPSQQAGNRNNKKQDLDYSVSAPRHRQLHPTLHHFGSRRKRSGSFPMLR